MNKELLLNLPLAGIRPCIPEFTAIDTVCGEQVSMALTGSITPKEACKTMAEETRKIFKASGRKAFQ